MRMTPDLPLPTLDCLFEHAAALIGQADALIIAAGAGMGIDSGLPDFRGSWLKRVHQQRRWAIPEVRLRCRARPRMPRLDSPFAMHDALHRCDLACRCIHPAGRCGQQGHGVSKGMGSEQGHGAWGQCRQPDTCSAMRSRSIISFALLMGTAVFASG
jgi:hypothetical protein